MEFELTFDLLDPPDWLKQTMIAEIVLFDGAERRILVRKARLGQRYPWKPGLWAFYWVQSRGRRFPFVAQLLAPNLGRRTPRRQVREFIRRYYPGVDPDSPFALKTFAATMHLWSSLEMPEPNQIPW